MKPDTIVLLILTSVLWGVTPIIEKIGLTKTDALTGVTIRSAAVTVGLFLYLAFSGKIKHIFHTDIKTVFIFSATGLIAGLLAMLTYFFALKKGAVSQIVPLAATYPLVTALLSILILGEQITPLRLMGTTLIIIGVWFVRG